MSLKSIVEGKQQWRAHKKRVKELPAEYQIVYDEIQKYLFKVGPVELPGGGILTDLADFFESGAAIGTPVMDLIGPDVAAFADGLIADSPTYAELYQQSARSKE